MKSVDFSVDFGVAFLLLDTPGSSVNVLTTAGLAEIADCLERIEKDPAIEACVIGSAKPEGFLAGADLHEFLSMTEPSQGEEFCLAGQEMLLGIERSRKPFVAAIHGAALGSGLDIALACRYRIATEHPKTVLGFPEISLGIVPGGGGTQRLHRLVGLRRALLMLVKGERLHAGPAYRAGLVDALTSPGGVLDTAALAARKLLAGRLPPRRPPPALDRLLALPPFHSFVIASARREVLRKTHGFYPAPLRILDCVSQGLRSGMNAGLARERTLFGRLVVSSDAKNLIRVFDATTELKKMPAYPAPRRVGRVAVLGAGLMGEGIAAVSLPLGPVVLKDVSDKALERAARRLHADVQRRKRAGAPARMDRDRQWYGLHTTTRAEDVASADLVVEAVFEELELKRRVLAETEGVVRAETVIGSNTSALPIAEIARDAAHPERVLGMHYFSPVPRMPLLEIVAAKKTAPWAVATARALGIAQGKTTIVVKDGPGFYTTRILAPYLNEAVLLLEEGADVRALDQALVDFGFLVGPATLLDEVGIDVGAHVTRELSGMFGTRGIPPSPTLPSLHAAGYLGKKNGRGFYRYDTPRQNGKHPNAAITPLLGGAPRRPMPGREMSERCVLMMVNEAIHCLGEEIIDSSRDGDVGAILGLGFPPFRGGPFRYVDALGPSIVVSRLGVLAARHGPRFLPAPLLLERARDERRFTRK